MLGDAGRGLVAVGRLDLATSGLLLLTSDTRLADWITDPVHEVARLYAVTVRGRVEDAHLAGLTGRITLRKASSRESHLLVELREGQNRQVRRMFDAIGREVTALKRVKLGGLDPGRPRAWAHAVKCCAKKSHPPFPERRFAKYDRPDGHVLAC